jgi:Ni/Co efflux regulator RcnB
MGYHNHEGLDMKTTVLTAALTAAALTFGGLALAQDRDGRQGRDDRHGQRDHDNDRDGKRGFQRGPNHPMPPQARRDERGAGPEHNFHRGGRLPIEYRNRGYWVDDWRGHRLSAPPRGYHWVQTGGDYVLVADQTGIIFQIYLGQ